MASILDAASSWSAGKTWLYVFRVSDTCEWPSVYNEALVRMQGMTTPAAFLLGRRWKDSKGRGNSALERLARVDAIVSRRGQASLRVTAENACSWIRRMRGAGGDWEVSPEPSVIELRPNMRHLDDQPWPCEG
jgi:hypothetical protein